MRQFKLYNSIGKYYDLNSIESFFHDPEGLGFENDAEYERIGSQFLRTESGMKQPEPSGKIRFIDYKTYNEFSKFLQNQPLRLEYTAAGKYYMNVNVKKIKKTELEGKYTTMNIHILMQTAPRESSGSIVIRRLNPR